MRYKIFNYGSNSDKQLRARVQDPNLTSTPAHVEGYARVFGGTSKGWGGGGVASIAPKQGAVVSGTIVEVSEQERQRLDYFEDYRDGKPQTYELTPITVRLGRSKEPGPEVSAYAYIRMECVFAEPTEQYLCAVHAMLSQNIDMSNQSILVRGVANGLVQPVFKRWKLPDARHRSIEALAVEVNQKMDTPREMPRMTKQFAEACHAIGLHSSPAIADAVKNGNFREQARASAERELLLDALVGLERIFR